jgi:UDP-N-acetyl-D-mannosaminuronate dehydrogenase
MDKTKKEILIGILGYGEIGSSLAKFYKNPKIKDLKRDDGLRGIDILHICIPYNDKFVEIIKKEIKEIRPKLTIIHSTIAPGTTKKIISGLPKDLRVVVHSPVRGVHPYLYEGIKTFVKYIGAEDKKAGEMAKKHLESLGIKTKLAYPSKTSELAKLFCTTYYGLCIAWHGEMAKICKKEKVNFDDVVKEFNKTYNEGYLRLDKKNVIRPVLFAPEKGIGGHCVVPNAKILKKYYKSKALDLILDYEPKK